MLIILVTWDGWEPYSAENKRRGELPANTHIFRRLHVEKEVQYLKRKKPYMLYFHAYAVAHGHKDINKRLVF